jgi:hypothetical protein
MVVMVVISLQIIIAITFKELALEQNTSAKLRSAQSMVRNMGSLLTLKAWRGTWDLYLRPPLRPPDPTKKNGAGDKAGTITGNENEERGSSTIGN